MKSSSEATLVREVGRVANNAAIVAFFTGLSRVAGLLREIVISHLFGASAVTDAFFLAFTIPNMMRRIVAEGALTVAFIPIYAQTKKMDGEIAAREFLRSTLGLLLIVLVSMVLLGTFGAKYLVYALASGFSANSDKFILATSLTQWMFCYVFFISLVALAMGVLNANNHFATPAASPIFLNLSMMFCAASLFSYFAEPIFALAVGVILGGILQLAIQVPTLYRMGLLVKPSLNFNIAPLKNLMKLMLPALFGVAVYQINLIVLRQLGSFLPDGHLSYYYNADRLMQFALGIFATSIATASLPTMSLQSSDGNNSSLLKTFTSSLRLSNLITIPSCVGLFGVAVPIVSVLYLHGMFTWKDAQLTAYTTMAFAPAIVSVSILQITVQVFYALRDMRTPVIIGAVTIGVNFVIGLMLLRFEVIGLGATVSISSWVQVMMLLAALRLKIGPLGLRSLVFTSISQCALALLAVAPAVFIMMLGNWQNGPGFLNIFILLCGIATAIVIYTVGALYLGFKEAEDIKKILLEKLLR